MIAILDSSIWVALFLPNDRYHATVKTWFNSYPSALEIVTPQLGIIEIASTLCRQKKSRGYVLRCLEIMKQMVQEPPAWHLYENGCLEAALTCSCRGADSVFIGLALYLQGTLFSLDEEQLKKGKKLVNCQILE